MCVCVMYCGYDATFLFQQTQPSNIFKEMHWNNLKLKQTPTTKKTVIMSQYLMLTLLFNVCFMKDFMVVILNIYYFPLSSEQTFSLPFHSCEC